MSGRQDEAFVRLVAEHRPFLLGAAYLMYGTAERARDVVEATLAQAYARWPTGPDLLGTVLVRVLRATPTTVSLPWQRRSGDELRESLTDSAAPPAEVVSAMARMPEDVRRTLVLVDYAGATPAAAARALGAGEALVLQQLAAGRSALDQGLGEGTDRTGALRAAAAAVPSDPVDPQADLGHGRMLIRRRDLRRVVTGAVVVLVLVAGVLQLSRTDPSTPAAAAPVPSTTASATTSTPACDTTQAGCRVSVVRQWRSQVALVAGAYVDPEGGYFSGYTAGSDDLYESDGIWKGPGGALGLDLSRLTSGGTEVFVQVATSPRYAVRCGTRTGHPCSAMRFMDGNVFTMTDSTQTARGMEVQYCPYGDEVITVIARDTGSGRSLAVDRSQLIALVQDPRLRLPHL